MYKLKTVFDSEKTNFITTNASQKHFTAGHEIRLCNICTKGFIPNTRFDRFCMDCRMNDEIYSFADGMN